MYILTDGKNYVMDDPIHPGRVMYSTSPVNAKKFTFKQARALLNNKSKKLSWIRSFNMVDDSSGEKIAEQEVRSRSNKGIFVGKNDIDFDISILDQIMQETNNLLGIAGWNMAQLTTYQNMLSTIAVSSKTDVKLLILADKVQNIEDEKRRLLRKMDRSMRSTNPENYNENGTIKKHGNKKVVWNKSNHYMKYQNQLKELYRKQADIRKYQHECLSNYIISLGNNIYVEHMNFAGLQKKSTKTERDDSGKFKRKKRFGKSLANRAPAMLMTIINRKLLYYGLELIEINTVKARASQFNHMTGEYHKKSLSQRWNDLDGIKIQRDLYSAFLIMNISSDLENFDIKKCNDRFDNFKILHDMEIQRLSNTHTLSSMGI